jgi:replicative DNA helicase
MPRPRRLERQTLNNLIRQVDSQPPGDTAPDTVPTGFPSLDKMLGGGVRRRDLVVLGGDIGAGKSALTLGIALRVAQARHQVVYLSGEMDEDRLMERALAIEGRAPVDTMRYAKLTDQARSSVGAAAVRLRDLPLAIYPLIGDTLDEVLAPVWKHEPALIVFDYLQLTPAPVARATQDEDNAATLKQLKAMAIERRVACLTVAQLPAFRPDRPDPRPTLDDFGVLGAVKQHADVVLGLYREEMYRPGGGVEGATELIVAKNRNGPTGFIDLYFYQRWMRFEDMLDPDQ